MAELKTNGYAVGRARVISPRFLLACLSVCLAACLVASLAAPVAAQFSHAPSPDRVVIPLVPTDVTNMRLFSPPPGMGINAGSMPKLNPGAAIKKLSEDAFPDLSQARESDDGLIVKPHSGCDMERPAPADVQLTSGTVFVSVRKPANMLFVTTPHGVVSVSHDGEAIVTFRDGLLKVLNLSAFGERVKVRIHHAAVSATINGRTYGDSAAASEGIVIAVKYGHELVAGDRPLTEADLRAVDGVGRRRSAMFENNHMAVSEFSLTTLLRDSDMLCNLGQNTDTSNQSSQQERRVLKDMAKMAAVLDCVNGDNGYVTAGKNKKFAEK